MRINMLVVFAIVFLSITIVTYALGVSSMIELWQISIALLAVSFGAWFEINSKYSENVKKLQETRLDKVKKKIEEICEGRQKGDKEGKIESEMESLTKLYKESNEPIELLKQTWNIFSIAGLSFLVAVFCRLGADLLSLPQLSSIEVLIFLVGIVLFIFAFLNTRELMNLLSSGKDPAISMLQIFIISLIQALHSYVIWILLPSFLSATLTIYQYIFFTLLWITFIGAGLLLWKREEPMSKEVIFGYTLICAPWIWLVVLAILTYVGYLH